MSNPILNRTWQVPNMKPSARLVLVNLADRANPKGICWPSQETIAANCSITQRHLRTVIRELETAGHLTVVQKSGCTARGEPRFEYVIHPVTTPEACSAVAGETASGVTPEMCSKDNGNLECEHRKSGAATPEIRSATIIVEPHEPVITQGGTEAPPHNANDGCRKIIAKSDYSKVPYNLLAKDMERLEMLIKIEKNGDEPDKAIIRAHNQELANIRSEVVHRAPPPKQKQKPAPEPSATTGPKFTQPSGTYDLKAEAENARAMVESEGSRAEAEQQEAVKAEKQRRRKGEENGQRALCRYA